MFLPRWPAALASAMALSMMRKAWMYSNRR